MPGSTTLWKDIATYVTNGKAWWRDEGGGNVTDNDALDYIDDKLDELATKYTAYKSALASTGAGEMGAGESPYLMGLFAYANSVSSLSGVPTNANFTQKFKENVSSAGGTPSTTHDDLRNMLLCWSYIGEDYDDLFTVNGSAVTDKSEYTSIYDTVNGGYANWKAYMVLRLETNFTPESIKNGIAQTWDTTISEHLGTNTDIWPLSSGADIRSIVLNTSNITTVVGATVVPMYLNDVLSEVPWSFVGINDAATYA